MSAYRTLPPDMGPAPVADQPLEHDAAPSVKASDVLLPAFIGLGLFWLALPVLSVFGTSPAASMTAAIVSGLLGLSVCLGILVRAGVISSVLAFFGIAVFFLRII